ncbi:MAG: hypothetical protein ACXAAI_16485, partial [Promethearchaeota archaeon]
MIYRKKMLICGDFRVGKTALLTRYIKGRFLEDYNQTVGANVVIKKIYLNQVRNSLDLD